MTDMVKWWTVQIIKIYFIFFILYTIASIFFSSPVLYGIYCTLILYTAVIYVIGVKILSKTEDKDKTVSEKSMCDECSSCTYKNNETFEKENNELMVYRNNGEFFAVSHNIDKINFGDKVMFDRKTWESVNSYTLEEIINNKYLHSVIKGDLIPDEYRNKYYFIKLNKKTGKHYLELDTRKTLNEDIKHKGDEYYEESNNLAYINLRGMLEYLNKTIYDNEKRYE